MIARSVHRVLSVTHTGGGAARGNGLVRPPSRGLERRRARCGGVAARNADTRKISPP